MSKLSIRYEDIRNTSARRLLKLSYKELDQLIEEADQVLDRAETSAYWLRGIKLEKTIREELRSQDGGEV